MAERAPEHSAGASLPGNTLIHPDATSSDHERNEEEPRGSLVLLLLFLAAMVGVWLYVYFLLLERA